MIKLKFFYLNLPAINIINTGLKRKIMKIFKTTILATVFLFGLTAMSDSSKLESTEQTQKLQKQVPCSTVFTVCDAAFPNDYNNFDTCMSNNGC